MRENFKRTKAEKQLAEKIVRYANANEERNSREGTAGINVGRLFTDCCRSSDTKY